MRGIIRADSTRIPLADRSVACTITSPPYFGQRSYGESEAEIGRGSYRDYLLLMRAVFEEVARVMVRDGVFWLNIGDTAANSGGAGGDYNEGGSKAGRAKYRQGDSRIEGHQMCLVPERLALLAQNTGWLVRQKIVWIKGQPERQDVTHVKRPLTSTERIYMLTRQVKSKYNPRPEVDPWPDYKPWDVWEIPPRMHPDSRGAQAPFPDELPARCILLSTDPGDVVFDPFVGSLATLRAAEAHGRRGVGVDLYAGVPT